MAHAMTGPATNARGASSGRDVRRRAGRAMGPHDVQPLEARKLLSGDGFERIDLVAGAGASSVVVADFDGNGMMDVATSNAGAGTLSVLLNSANGFHDAVNYDVGGTPTRAWALDINDDGSPDLVTLDAAGGRLALLTNDGEGGFVDHGGIQLPEGATSATPAHLNADGSMEIVIAFSAQNRAAVYRIVDTGDPENPTGIELSASYDVGSGPTSVIARDVNQDGAADIITTNAGGTVSVLLNHRASVGTDELITRLYRDLFDRVPTTPERTQAGELLNAGASGRLELVTQLIGSTEFSQSQIRHLFTQYMGRNPTDQEMQTLAAVFAQRGEIEEVKEAVLGSSAYFSTRAESNVVAFVNHVYADLLGRPVDPQIAQAAAALINGGLSREDFVKGLIDTPDYRASVLKGIFDHHLHRMPSEAELQELFGNFEDDSGGHSGGNGGGEGGGGGSEDFSIDAFLATLLASNMYFDFAGGGSGLFEAAATYQVGAGPSSVVVNDVNGDLRADLIVTNTDSDTVSILLGQSGGTFTSGSTINVGDQPVHTLGYFKPGFGFVLMTVSRGEDSISGHRIDLEGKVTLFGVIKVGDQPSWAAPGIFSASGGDGIAVANAGDGTVTIITFTDDHGNGDSGGGDSGEDHGYDDVAVPAVPDLAPAFDLGASDSDNITPLNNAAGRSLAFRVDDVQRGMFVNLYVDGVRLGSGLVRSDEGHLYVQTDGTTVLTDGTHLVTASITVGGREGKRSDPLAITIKSPRVEVNNTDPNEPTNNDGRRARARVDEMGRPIVTVEDGQGGSTEYNLHDLFDDAPAIQGDLVVVDEVKHEQGSGAGAHARRYAAGQTSQGLMLFVNNEDGSWHERNLTDDVPGAEAFASDDLDVLTTPWGNSNIFGKNAQGELVAYWQDGSEGSTGFNWNFVNLGEHLAQTGQDQPAWNGDIESYSVPWGGMNVIAVDANGDVTAVWWAPGLDHWVYSNLTEITGAQKLVGTVSVSVTPWGGVNVLGTDAMGHTIALWWAPGYDWQVTDMTLLANAPDFASGTASSFSSVAGDIVVAGLTEQGNLAIFRWSLNVQTWQVAEITPPAEITSSLVGQVTGFANANSQLFVLASNVEGEVVQFAFDAAHDHWDVSVL